MNNTDHTIHLRKPRVTEKSSLLAEQNIYAFEVAREATKMTIMQNVKQLYNVTPLRVNIVNIPAKKKMSKGKVGKKQAIKKAYIYLKKGDTIDIA
jgi:large subunit ribosomal protein L23